MLGALAAVAIAVAMPSHAPKPLDKGCSQTTTTSVLKWISAYDTGDTKAIDALFAPSRAFESYSSIAPASRRGKAARNRGTLVRYFTQRHTKGDRVRAKIIQMNSATRKRGTFKVEVERMVPGYRDGRWTRVVGTGVVRCDLKKISRLDLTRNK